MKQSAMLTFECADFVVSSDEDSETNPGIFGRALAQWLAQRLHAEGFPAGAVFAEDFGWCIPVGGRPYAIYVVCASTGHSPDQWRVFAFAEVGIITRLLGNDRRAALLDEVFAAVRRCLESTASVRGLREETI